MTTNNNKKLLDVPFFELMSQAPVASSAVAGLTAVEEGNDRFMYYLTASTFYRYDAFNDTWQQLASPVTAPVTGLSMKYTRRRGYHGRVLAAGSTTIRIPGIRGNVLNGKEIRILYGAGAGQNRTLTYVGETTHDAGVITAVLGSNVGITDNLKKWRVNQWAGYTLAITYNTGATTYRKILYNTTTDIYISDVNLQPHEPWNNMPFYTATPYVIPVVTAGSQAHYQIMSADYTVDSAWTVTPDTGSYFTTLTGGIYLLSSAAATPFFTFQYYDVINDMWQTKTVPQGLLAAQGTDFAIERTGKIGTIYFANTGTVSSTSRTMLDDGLTLERDRYANHRILITGGTGAGQNRRIVAHTSNTFTIARNWETTPDATSTYEVWPDFDRLYFLPGGTSTIFAYSAENDHWMQGQSFDDGITSNITASYGSWLPIGVTTGARIAAGVTAINPIPTAGGTNYSIGDVLTHSTGGTGAQVRVKSTTVGGVVTELELVHVGTATGFTTGVGKTVTGGTGSGLTFEITTVGAAALITTASNHFLKTGDSVTFAGCTDATWNAAYTIIGVPAINTFCVATSAAASMSAAVTQSTTTIYDPSKTWVPNEHAGRLVHLMVAGTAPTSQIRWVLGNSHRQLNVATITAGVVGTSKYAIYDAKIFGVDDLRKEDNMKGYGWANTGSFSSIVDNTKNWVPGQWNNFYMKIEAGAGYGTGRLLIANNSSNTLNFSANIGFLANTSTKYEIADAWGNVTIGGTATIADNTKPSWPVNIWAGKTVKITGGTAVSTLGTISASVANTLTVTVTTDTTSTYAIPAIPARGVGTQFMWNWGQSDNAKRGRYIYSSRGGGSNTLDIYDVVLGRWIFGIFLLPQNEGFTTGSSLAYDGHDKIYISRSATTQPLRIFEFDLANNTINGAKTTTWLQGTATIGNFMEVVETPDGTISYMYVLQNTGTLLSRAMIF
jgi:hypothetical protein